MVDLASLPPLNALRAFEAAGRHLNFRAAADELGVTQGAVVQHVRGLEARLDLQLFERRHKSLAFTHPGRGYHAQVSRAFAILAGATAQLTPAPEKVTISVTPTFASKWLIPHLPDFTTRYPDIDLRIMASESLSRFHSEGIDLVVRQGGSPFGAGLEARRLFKQEIIAVCAPDLIDGCALPLSGADLGGLVLLHDTHNLWSMFLSHVSGAPVAPGGKGLRFSQTAHSIDAALAGQGIALASRFLVNADLQAGRLVQPIAGSLRGERDFYLLSPRRPRRSKAAEAVWQWLLAQRQTEG